MKKRLKLSIIYVYYNTPKELIKSIGSVKEGTGISDYEIIIVDNNSPKKVPNFSNNKKIRIVKNPKNTGFGSGCNLGAQKSKGEFLLFVNPDTIFKQSAIDQLLSVFEANRKIGVAGPKMVNSKGITLPTTSTFISPLNALMKFSGIGRRFTKNAVTDGKTDVLSGACMLLPKRVFVKVGGFDERFFMYFEEQDLCKRVVENGYKVYYCSKSKIVHHIGRSLQDKARIQKYFQESRFKYMRKHFGLTSAIFTEGILRLFNLSNIGLLFVFFLSFGINTYRMDELMLFIGDSARDFIEAYRMVNDGYFPLVGIPSSVTWLHQGAVSIWLIGFSFVISGSNTIFPGYLFGIISAISTALLFKLGSILFDKKTGFLAALLFATAPMIVVNSRMPYHTSIVPFFTIIFFLVLFYSIKNRKYLPIVFFLYGLLLQVELSNAIVLGVIAILIVYSKYRVTRSIAIKSTIGFLIGIFPFILYDLINGPSYLLFPLWVLNRLRLSLAKLLFGGETAAYTGPEVVYQQITSAIFPYAPNLILIFFVASLMVLSVDFIRGRKLSVLVVMLWLLVPLASFLMHGSPGTAYFALIYPAISIALAYGLVRFLKYSILPFILVAAIGFINVLMLVRSDFYVTSYKGANPMPPTLYFFGQTYAFSEKIADEILKDANGKSFKLAGAGSLTMFETSLDTYKFLIINKGGVIDETSKLHYTIYVEPNLIKQTSSVIYKGVEGYIVRE